MGSNFRKNLRSELDFQGIIVKELSVKTGIPVATLDCYLKTQSTEPSAENAVKIARALAVSVEYLVTGETGEPEKPPASLSPDGRMIIRQLGKLSPEQCRAILSLIYAFRE
ncbi:MAG: helix-turn-helix domain-containing protein [Treponema sp.]|jgi:transcriptional regulator with XRE-family HTH domain|nr:helix-turn-helix domain-containing protein [Treponema sp.]